MSRPQDASSPLVAVVVVILTVVDDDLQVLLVHRSGEPFRDFWALPGGFLAEGESLDAAAARKLLDETGVQDVYLEQLFTFGELASGDARRRSVAVAYFALVQHGQVRLRERSEWQPAWHEAFTLPRLGFDNNIVVDYAIRRLRSKLEYTNVAYSLLPKQFTLSELQQVYEAILDRELDKRNFRRRMLSLGIIKPAGGTRMEGAHRPAQLYTFVRREPMTV
ncbi:MAG TPA: NUDIX domain-containing protein [Dehalococcoidia bacterium]|nr:NUDIX domain-containing protein [Dehalococcoidia bacterium]